jgi:transketolase
MRAIPGMTVIDVADAVETRQAVAQLADLPGPVYLRLKRGEIPVIFEDNHRFCPGKAQVLTPGGTMALIACGMMLPAALAAAEVLEAAGVPTAVVNAPVIKPLDTATILGVARDAQAVVTAENHSVIGGLGSAVAEALATAGLGRPLRRVGVADTFAEGAKTSAHLFRKYGLSSAAVVAAAWAALGRDGPPPAVPEIPATAGEYAPV